MTRTETIVTKSPSIGAAFIEHDRTINELRKQHNEVRAVGKPDIIEQPKEWIVVQQFEIITED